MHVHASCARVCGVPLDLFQRRVRVLRHVSGGPRARRAHPTGTLDSAAVQRVLPAARLACVPSAGRRRAALCVHVPCVPVADTRRSARRVAQRWRERCPRGGAAGPPRRRRRAASVGTCWTGAASEAGQLASMMSFICAGRNRSQSP